MDLFELVANKDNGALRTALADDPAAATSRNDAGASLLAWTVYVGNGDAQELVRAAAPTLDPYEAIILGDVDRVKDLLANRWDGNELSPDGFPPLALAAFFGNEAVFDLLLPLTREVNAQATNPQKVAALHAATAQRQAGMVEKLLAAGADPNLVQAGGFTPLHAAAANGDATNVDLLRKAGADVSATNDTGETAADLARSKGHDRLAEALGAAN
jgi:ankyrin repeat protein